jgi:hypothetical protein
VRGDGLLGSTESTGNHVTQRSSGRDGKVHARGLRVKFGCLAAPQLPLKVHANFLGRQLLRLLRLLLLLVTVVVVLVVALLWLFQLLLSLQLKKGGSGGGGDVVVRVAGIVVG